MLTTVSAFREPWEAHMFCWRLNAEGIPAFVAHENHIGNRWDFSILLGGVKVQVPDERQEEARAVERSCREGAFKPLLVSEFGFLEEQRCPHCGSGKYRKRRPVVRAALAISLSFLAGAVLPPLGWIYRCENCRREYRVATGISPVRKWATVMAIVAGQTIILSAIILCAWLAFNTRFSLAVVILCAIFAARMIARKIASLGPEPD